MEADDPEEAFQAAGARADPHLPGGRTVAASWPVVALLVPVVLIQLATAPLSAHMVGRQAYRNGTIEERALFVDELAESTRTPPAAGG